jgi:hypothetical protein
MAILWSRRQNVGNEVKAQGLVEVEVVVVAVMVEAVFDLLQTMVELTALPSLEL